MISEYIQNLFVPKQNIFQHVEKTIQEHGMPNISVSPESGKLLYLLVKMTRAKRVLEVGALGGYSGIWLASALSEDGTLTSLEINEQFAKVASQNMQRAGLEEKVTYQIGPALISLQKLKENGESFDFFFIDADKENYRNYVDACIEVAQKGAVITVDNVLWKGEVAKEGRTEKAEIIHRFNEYCANHPRLDSIIIPIGDGLTVSVVK